MKRRQAIKSILVTNGLLLSGLGVPVTSLAGSGPSMPSAASAPSAPSAPSKPSIVSAPSTPSAVSAPSVASAPSRASLPSTASKPSGPDGYLDDIDNLDEAQRQALIDRIKAELQSDGLQTVSASNLNALLAEFL